MQENLVQAFSMKELRDIMDDMFLDDTVDLVEEMPANVWTRSCRRRTRRRGSGSIPF